MTASEGELTFPKPPDELLDSEAYELARLRERDRLRQYGDSLFEAKRQRIEAQEEEFRRIRIPVGIIWRDPRDMQGWGGYILDDEERELLDLIRKHRKGRS
jgi:hypothetical protein